MNNAWLLTAPLLFVLAACSEEPAAPADAEASEQGGEATGEVEGGSISDAMIPLEALESQSPSLRRQTTTVVTTRDDEDASQTTVETTIVTTNAAPQAPAPAPPVPPERPRG